MGHSGERVGKRMAYILRYGALNEGLEVSSNGYAKIDDLLQLGLMHNFSKEDVLSEAKKKTVTGHQRFDIVSRDGIDFIRASFGRNFAPAQKHENSEVTRLLEMCIAHLCRNIKKYDLEDFPDEYLLSRIYYRLKFEKRLTFAAMQSVIGNVMERIDLNDVYITEKMLRLICERCPNLKILILKTSGYIITDTVLKWLLKKLTDLTKLSICGCETVTDCGLKEISKSTKKLEKLNISHLPLVTKDGIKDIVKNCVFLKQLYVQGNRNVDWDFIEELIEINRDVGTSSTDLQVYATSNT